MPAAQVSALHALGPDYQSTFSTLETDAALEQVPAAAALVTDGKDSLEARLLLSYNAQVLPHHRMTRCLHCPGRHALGLLLTALNFSISP